jgi:hypothetical protein
MLATGKMNDYRAAQPRTPPCPIISEPRKMSLAEAATGFGPAGMVRTAPAAEA